MGWVGGGRPAGRRDGRSRRVVAFGSVVTALGAVLLAPVSASGIAGAVVAVPAATGTVQLVPGVDPPTPYAPVDFTASGTGCPPNAPVAVGIGLREPASDSVTYHPVATATPLADLTGAWTVSMSFPTAYPGTWSAWSACSTSTASVQVPDPDPYELAVTPLVVVADTPTVVELRGVGCRSPEASWRIGGVPGAFAGGTVPIAGGVWTATATVVLPASAAGTEVAVVGVCRFADGAEVVMGASTNLSVVAAPTSSSPSSAPPTASGGSGPAPAIVASPTFTG